MNPDLVAILAATLRDQPISEVLRERITLAKERAELLQAEIGKEREEKKELESEVEMLRDALNHRAARIRELEAAASQKQSGRRTESEDKILVSLIGSRSQNVLQIAQITRLPQDDIDVMLSDMHQAELVSPQYFMSYGLEDPQLPEWRLSIEGKRYIATHGLRSS